MKVFCFICRDIAEETPSYRGQQLLQVQDKVLKSFPEVERVFEGGSS